MKVNIEGSERRYFDEPVLLKREENKESRRVEGYALKFNALSKNLGWFREKIDRHALDNADMTDVVALFNHDFNRIFARTISKTLELTVDDTGLKYAFEAPNTTDGNDLIELLSRGDIQHSSFQFTVEEQKWEEDDEAGEIRTILKIKKLYDVSPVVFPAYPQTDVAKRSFEEWNGKRSEDTTLNSGSTMLRMKTLLFKNR